MTSERLASFIKEGGNDEFIPILWERVRKLLYMWADKYFRAYGERLTSYGITSSDLKQESYNAFLKAIEGFDEDKGYKFTSYLHYPFKNIVRQLLTRDLLNNSVSLNETCSDDEDSSERIELVCDEHALDFVEELEERSEKEMICEVVQSAVSDLPETEQVVIREYYFNNRTLSAIAEESGVSVERIRQRKMKALAILRKSSQIKRLYSDLHYTSAAAYRSGLSDFRKRGFSSVERIAIERVDIETAYREKLLKMMDEYKRNDS